MGPKGGPKPKTTVLARISINLLDWEARSNCSGEGQQRFNRRTKNVKTLGATG
jgi:hypothetical protein